MAQEFDPFKTSSGLPDDVDLTMTDCHFEFDPEYNNGDTLVLKYIAKYEDDDFDDQERLLSCGDGWTTRDKGKTAEREDGKTKSFNNRSYIGMWLDRALESGAEDVMRERWKNGDAPNGPMSAALWEGLTFHVNIEEIDYGGEIGKIPRALPSKFVGVNGASGGTAKAKAKGGAAKTKPKGKAPAKKGDDGDGEWSQGDGLTDDITTRIDAIADAHAEYEDFLTAAYEQMPEEMGDSEVEDYAVDPEKAWTAAIERATS